jgi:predicted peptidase
MKSAQSVTKIVRIPEDTAWMSRYRMGLQQTGKRPLPYRIFVPENAEGALPVVFHFHGVRGRGDDNVTQLKAGNRFGPAYFASDEVQAKFPAIVVVPQCPKGKYWVNFTMGSTSKQLRKAIKLLEELKSTYDIDSTRVYISGQSMGGFATWAALVEFPETFAAAVAVSGGGNVRKARSRLNTPIWAFHGAQDPLVGVWRSRNMVASLEKAGKPLCYTEFEEGKHDIWPLVYGDLKLAEWMFGFSKS